MKIVYHSSVFTAVRRTGPDEVLAQSTLLSTDCEAVASVRASASNFIIGEAGWDVYWARSGGKNGGGSVAELTGKEAYFQAGEALRAVQRSHGELPRNLLAECIRGIIQAETYLFRDRGYSSAEEFEETWKQSYLNSCRLYSNMARCSQTWYEYVGGRKWGDSLFHRSKSAAVARLEDGSLMAQGGFSDSFHELGLVLAVVAGRVTSAKGNFLRVPDPICRETAAHLASLIDRDIAGLSKQEVGRWAGGPEGCSHLVDLVDHAVRALRDSQTS